ncbi:hypothetical protein PMIN01_04850 [Paraphaeosphaeria minitans]|uniref:Uncharacterized protein n=1 Tax=Paraphaeosphaeria minitans TaxID=565426 RepID=A0A9P6GKT3_9PLEO|nr:hypothetical protein PMIN01_04850 [Paraphaeosphaeria minitans]
MHACITRRLSLFSSLPVSSFYLNIIPVCRWSYVSKHDSPQSFLFYTLDVFNCLVLLSFISFSCR